MKYNKTLITTLAAFALITSVACADTTNTVTTTDQWNLTLAGSGKTTTETPTKSSVAFDIGLGRTGELVLPLEAGVRQSISFDNADGNSAVFGTRAYSDWTIIKVLSVEFAAGGNIGADYGDTTMTWTLAPEIVGRLWLKSDVYAYARAEYPYNISTGTSENALEYTIGVGVRF